MEKMNDKTTRTRMFNELLREQRVNFLYRTLLCLLLLVPANSVCAQSNDDKVEIPLVATNPDGKINDEELPKRDSELEAILPAAMYDVSNDNLVFISRYVTFESVTYYIMNANSIVIETDEIVLPKNVEITLPIAQLPSGSYRILFEIDGVYFQGRFVK